MASLPFRTQHYLVSILGTLLILPLYLFWGGAFSYSFTALDSIWAWGFGLITCWSQILAILFSFFKPRSAARWMIINIALSILMVVGQLAEAHHRRGSALGSAAIWLQSWPDLLRIGAVFWAPPCLFAILLFRRSSREQESPKPLISDMRV